LTQPSAAHLAELGRIDLLDIPDHRVRIDAFGRKRFEFKRRPGAPRAFQYMPGLTHREEDQYVE